MENLAALNFEEHLHWPQGRGKPDAGMDISFADLPQIRRRPIMLEQMALVAELEAGFISDRTKAALAAAKRRGKKLGGFRAGAKLTAKARQKGAEAKAVDLAPVITELQASGATPLRAIASSCRSARPGAR